MFLSSSAAFYFIQLSLKMSESWRRSKVMWLLFGSSSAHMSRVDTLMRSAASFCSPPLQVQQIVWRTLMCLCVCLCVWLSGCSAGGWALSQLFQLWSEVKWSEVKWSDAVRWAKNQSELRLTVGVVTALHTFRSNRVNCACLVNKAAAGRLHCQNNCSGGSLNAPLSEISFWAGRAWTRKKHSSGSWRSWVTVQPCFVDAVSKPVKVTERSHVFTGSRKNREKHDKRNSDPLECG